MRKRYTVAFKARVIQELPRGEKTIAQIAAAHKVHPNHAQQVEGDGPERPADAV